MSEQYRRTFWDNQPNIPYTRSGFSRIMGEIGATSVVLPRNPESQNNTFNSGAYLHGKSLLTYEQTQNNFRVGIQGPKTEVGELESKIVNAVIEVKEGLQTKNI